MEEEKAAAYYDELTRKGEGAARFKQGLGYSSSSASDSLPSKSSTSASLFSSFVRASSPGKAVELERQSVVENIHNKLTKDRRRRSPSPPSDRGRGGRRSGNRDDRRSGVSRHRRSSSTDRRRERDRSHSPRHRHRSREREERRHRSRSPSREKEGRRGGHRDRNGDSHRRSSRCSRSRSPYRSARSGDRERGSHEREKGSLQRQSSKTKSGSTNYSKLIEGYSQMTPAERVKAKMKLQLSETAAKDTARGVNTGWERFDFNKDAPLDDDDEIEVADDDASLVKDIGKSFRFSAVEAKREEQVKAAHDEAIFGASTASPIPEIGTTEDNDAEDGNETHVSNALISDKGFLDDELQGEFGGLASAGEVVSELHSASRENLLRENFLDDESEGEFGLGRTSFRPLVKPSAGELHALCRSFPGVILKRESSLALGRS
ncbi:serine/threonine-protein kinase fray2 [Cocos nucifera]|uniref:Serine/threonine-protein kinase fray2 n=1 Tax=Cocos nucifera TaxID=13894 RepID=A0A8K0N9E0_COCNU|nr:serine/threonine-protein kinase fray2 [Cocos nucifera]